MIVVQDDAIAQIVNIYQIHLIGMGAEGRPVGNFLFLGPTGSGKTRIVEATAEPLVSDSRAVVKIDCGEFQHSHEIPKLIGSPPGYLGHRETHPLLSQETLNQYHTENVRLSFVLFDEIEKASDALWNLLLGILDKANPDAWRQLQVDTISAQISRSAVEAARKKFTPEFINCLDKIVTFQPLGNEELKKVLDIELSFVQQRIFNMGSDRAFALSLSDATKNFLIEEGPDLKYGARHLKRAVERLLVIDLEPDRLGPGPWRRPDPRGVR